MDGALIRQDQDACFFLCNDVNVTITTDSSLVTSLQVDNGARKCSSYGTSQSCDGPVYYLQRKEKRVYVVDGSQSRWWNTMHVCKSTCVDSTPRLTPHMSLTPPPFPLPTGCTPVPAPIPHWVMIVPIVVGLLLFAVIAIIAAKLIIVFLVRICSSYIHHLCLHSETVYCSMHCATLVFSAPSLPLCLVLHPYPCV